MAQRPLAVGLFVCEKTVVEENTRNVSLINSIARFHVPELPSPSVRFDVLAALTDGNGQIQIDFLVYRPDNLGVIYERTRNVIFASPLQEVVVLFREVDCSFPVAGRYLLTLLADKEIVAQRALRIVLTDTNS